MHTAPGQYRICETAGRGGMGIVYRAVQTDLGRTVALKYLHGDINRDIVHEARLLARLDHPNIVKIHGFEQSGQCIVMEWIDGQPLSRRLKSEGAMDCAKAILLARQISAALLHAVSRGVLHGDIKASNVLIDEAGSARLVDFGLAISDASTQADRIGETEGGTIGHVAPEVLRGSAANERSELFSFGVLLYQLLTGRLPFGSGSVAKVTGRVIHAQPPPITSRAVPDWAKKLVGSLLSKRPQDRPAGFADVHAQLAGESKVRSKVRLPGQVRLRPYAIGLGLLGAVVFFAWMLPRTPMTHPLRIAVSAPVTAEDELTHFVWGSSTNALYRLKDVEVVLLMGEKPFEPRIERLDVRAIASTSANVRLTRVDGQKRVVAQTSISLPRHLIGTLDGERLVEQAIVGLFGREASGRRAVSSRPIGLFTQIIVGLDAGTLERPAALERILALPGGLHEFPAAGALAFDLAFDLHDDTREASYLESAGRILEQSDFGSSQARLLRQYQYHYRAGNRHIAADTLKTLRRDHPHTAEYFRAAAMAAEADGDLSAAYHNIESLVDIRPSWGDRVKLGELARRLGQFDAARSHYVDALILTPENTRVLSALGQVDLLSGRLADAIAAYSALLERRQHRSYYVNLGIALTLVGRLDEAESALRSAAEIAPNHPVVVLNLADVLTTIPGAHDEAMALYQSIVERDLRPNSASDQLLFAQAHARLGNVAQAIQHSTIGLTISPQDPDIHFQAALVFALSGNRPLADAHAKLAREGGIGAHWFSWPGFDPGND